MKDKVLRSFAYIVLVILASIEKLITLSPRKSVKNIVLWAITYIILGVFILCLGATEAEPIVIKLLFGSMAWLFPFLIINKRRFD